MPQAVRWFRRSPFLSSLPLPLASALSHTPNVRQIAVQRNRSKDIRKLRLVLRDPVAREHFLSDDGSVDSALLKLGPAPAKKRQGLAGDIQALADVIKGYPWTTLANLKGDPEVVRALDETEKLLKELKRALSKS